MKLTGKVTLITGASRGIGRAIAQKFAAAGSHIAFTYLGNAGQEQARELEALLKALGVKAKSYCSDAADFNATASLISDVLQDFGKIDVLVNNAGITKDNLLLRMDVQDWDDVIRVNLKSSFNAVKAVTQTFMKQRSGAIINISSVVGIKGNAGQANYAASKAGMIGFTKSIALEMGSRNIRANAIAPGFIITAMTDKLKDTEKKKWKEFIPLKRMGQVEDVANCALFLASDAAGYITGQVIQVDGGMVT